MGSPQPKSSLQKLAMVHLETKTSLNVSDHLVPTKPGNAFVFQPHRDVSKPSGTLAALSAAFAQSQRPQSSGRVSGQKPPQPAHSGLSQLVSHHRKTPNSSASLDSKELSRNHDGQKNAQSTSIDSPVGRETFQLSSKSSNNPTKLSLSDLSKQQHSSNSNPSTSSIKKSGQPSLFELIQIHQSKGNTVIPSSSQRPTLSEINGPLATLANLAASNSSWSHSVPHSTRSHNSSHQERYTEPCKVQFTQGKNSHMFGFVMSSTRHQEREALVEFQCYVLQRLRSQYDKHHSLDIFSIPSPDDLVREKQKKGFRKK